MDCQTIHGLTTKEFWTAFRRKVAQRRIPMSGTIELTRCCNLRCVHCYLGDQGAVAQKSAEEIDTEIWLRIIDEFSEAGCLSLLITGGEPLLRKDFPQIYRHAKRKGLLITIFSNGTRVSETVLALLRDYPPISFEISIYGATAETYERITRVNGSFQRCIDGIEKLLWNGIHLNLKTVLMKDNQHEIEMMQEIAKNYGVGFRFDAAVSPQLSGNRSPVDRRVPPAEVVEIEFADPEREKKWRDYYLRMEDIPPSEILYDCGAGLFGFHVTAYGDLQPCLMTEHLRHPLTAGNFEYGWRQIIPQIKQEKIEQNLSCGSCKVKPLCGFCPPVFQLENGSEKHPSRYLCELGHRRLAKIRPLST